MTNIAEGLERTGSAEKLHFYNIARASGGEVRSLLYVVEDDFPALGEHASLLRNFSAGVGKFISGLIASTQRRSVAKTAIIATLAAVPIFYILYPIFAS